MSEKASVKAPMLSARTCKNYGMVFKITLSNSAIHFGGLLGFQILKALSGRESEKHHTIRLSASKIGRRVEKGFNMG